jgi:hypothetical protein
LTKADSAELIAASPEGTATARNPPSIAATASSSAKVVGVP